MMIMVLAASTVFSLIIKLVETNNSSNNSRKNFFGDLIFIY